jgi:hypothetical protein
MRVGKKLAPQATSGVQGNRRMIAHSPAPIALAQREALSSFLALRSVPPPPPQARSAILWGDASVARIAVRTAAEAVNHGVTVAVIDAAMAFDVTAIAAYAQAHRAPPERFLRHIYIARAFTCHQVATLLCDRLDPLLALQQVGLVVLLGPCTTFFDENVPFKDAFLLFQRVLGKLEALCTRSPLLLIAQALDGYRTRRTLFVRELVKAVELGIRVSTVEGRRCVQLVKPRRPG